ncbi:MAG: hypothetical protein V1720_12300 [bacterium]
MRKLLFISFLLFSVGNYEAQDSASTSLHHIGFSFGLDQIKEENLIPKVHSGLISFVSYRLETKNNTYNVFDFNFGYGIVNTEIENEAVSFNFQLSAGYCYDLFIVESNILKYYLGPKIAYTSSLAEYGNFDEAHAYWGNYLSLGASNVIFLNVDSGKYFVFNLDLSVFGFYTRPEYNRLYSNEYWTVSHIFEIMNSHYKFGFPNNAFQLRASAEYRTGIWDSNYLSLALSVYFSRIKAADGKPLKELIPKFSIGIWL